MRGVSVSIDRLYYFYDNAAESGGSLYISLQADISESRFINNRAIESGGAVYLSSFCISCDIKAVSIQGSSFFNNTASQGVGGALFITRHNVSLTGNVFSYNVASFCGALRSFLVDKFQPLSAIQFKHNRKYL